MSEEFTNNFTNVVPRGNVIGDNFGYSPSSFFTGINANITETEFSMNDIDFNAMSVKTAITDLMTINSDEAYLISGLNLSNDLIKFNTSALTGNFVLESIIINEQLEIIRENLIDKDLTFLSAMTTLRGVGLWWSDGEITEATSDSFIVNSGLIELYGSDTTDNLFIPVIAENNYTFSTKIKQSNYNTRIGIICYSATKEELFRFYSDSVTTGENNNLENIENDTILYLTQEIPQGVSFVSLIITNRHNKDGSDVELDENGLTRPFIVSNELMFNQGDLKDFSEGSERGIFNQLFADCDYIKIVTTNNFSENVIVNIKADGIYSIPEPGSELSRELANGNEPVTIPISELGDILLLSIKVTLTRPSLIENNNGLSLIHIQGV